MRVKFLLGYFPAFPQGFLHRFPSHSITVYLRNFNNHFSRNLLGLFPGIPSEIFSRFPLRIPLLIPLEVFTLILRFLPRFVQILFQELFSGFLTRFFSEFLPFFFICPRIPPGVPSRISSSILLGVPPEIFLRILYSVRDSSRISTLITPGILSWISLAFSRDSFSDFF